MTLTPLDCIQLPSCAIAYRQSVSCSEAHLPPLILLHGWAGSSRDWETTLDNLSDIRCIYALDLPGYGKSPPLNQLKTLSHTGISEHMAALVIQFADAMGLEQFDINGHSFATMVATYVAAYWPQRVRRLVLTCASTYRNEAERLLTGQVHQIMQVWVNLRRPWMTQVRPVYRTMAGRYFYRLPANDALLRDIVDDFLQMDKQTGIISASDSSNPNFNTALQQVAAPTLVVGARQDTIMPPAGTPHVARLLPNGKLTWIDRCGHLPMIERPEIYNRLLRDFLTGALHV